MSNKKIMDLPLLSEAEFNPDNDKIIIQKKDGATKLAKVSDAFASSFASIKFIPEEMAWDGFLTSDGRESSVVSNDSGVLYSKALDQVIYLRDTSIPPEASHVFGYFRTGDNGYSNWLWRIYGDPENFRLPKDSLYDFHGAKDARQELQPNFNEIFTVRGGKIAFYFGGSSGRGIHTLQLWLYAYM